MNNKTLTIRVFHGDKLVDTQTLDNEVIKIGKLRSSHIYLDHDSIARMHAVLEVAGDELRVLDLGSPGGVQVNGQRVDKCAPLGSGDQLGIGPYRLELELEIPATAERPAPAPATLAPLTVAPLAPLARQTPIIDPRECEVHNGTRVAEVVAIYGSTVLDVQHVGQLKDRRSRAPAWLALGGGLMLAGLGLFGYEVSQDWEGYDEQVVAAQVDGSITPERPGAGLGGFGVALALLGLVPFGLGTVRMGDAVRRDFTIGEGHDASFHVPTAGLPDPSGFPLVRGADESFTLSFTAEMGGEVTLDGETVDLSQLASSGRAAQEGSYYSLPLPPGATCRVIYNDVTFYVNSVAPGAVIARKSERDRSFWAYNMGSLAALGSMLLLSQMIPADSQDLMTDEGVTDNRFVGYLNQPDRAPEEEPTPTEETASESEAGSSNGERSAGEEGAAGKPKSRSNDGRMAVKGPQSAIPRISRDYAPELAARNAGILGVMHQESGHFLASPHGYASAVGNDDADLWGNLTGTEAAEAYGVGGLGLVGTGRLGGGTGEGTVGLSHTGLIGGAGDGRGGKYGRGKGTGFADRGARVPTVRQAKATVNGELDKDIVRRIVRAHINEVRHCYNQGLAHDKNLRGRVAVQFTIGGSGKVPTAVVANTTVKDTSVGNCIAKAVRRWKFPKPRGGGSVIVTYPFVLEAAGASS